MVLYLQNIDEIVKMGLKSAATEDTVTGTVQLSYPYHQRIVRVRRWLSLDRYVTFVIMGYGCPSHIRTLLQRLEYNPKLGPDDIRQLTKNFGPFYHQVLGLGELKTKNGIRFVFDRSLPLDGSIGNSMHTIADVAFEGSPISEICAWTKTSTSPCSDIRLENMGADKLSDHDGRLMHYAADTYWTNRLLDDIFFTGSITVRTRDVLPSIIRMRHGYCSHLATDTEKMLKDLGYTGSPLPSYLTKSHVLKIIKSIGGIKSVSRNLNQGRHCVLIGANPVGVLSSLKSVSHIQTMSKQINHVQSTFNFNSMIDMTRRQHASLLQNYVNVGLGDKSVAYDSVIETVSRDDFGRMLKKVLTHDDDPSLLGMSSRISGYFMSDRLFFSNRIVDVNSKEDQVWLRGAIDDDNRRLFDLMHQTVEDKQRQAKNSSHPKVVGTTRFKAVSIRNNAWDSLMDLTGSGIDNKMTKGKVDLDALFALMHTRDSIPFVKYYDGLTNTYKVNRMALHRQTVSLDWIIGHIRDTSVIPSNTKSKEPHIMFALKMSEEDHIDRGERTDRGNETGTFRIMVYDDHRIDVKRNFDESEGAVRSVLSRIVDSVRIANRSIVVPINRKEGGEGGTIKRVETEEDLMHVSSLIPFVPFDPFVTVNASESISRTTRLTTVTQMKITSRHFQPSMKEIVRTLNTAPMLTPHICAALLSPAGPVEKRECIVFYKRVDNLDSDPYWVAVWQSLLSGFCIGFEGDVVQKLSEVFMMTEERTRDRLAVLPEKIRDSQLLGNLKFKIQTDPINLPVPHAVISNVSGGDGYTVTTYNVIDPLQVFSMVDVIKHAIKDTSVRVSSNARGKSAGVRQAQVQAQAQAQVQEQLQKEQSNGSDDNILDEVLKGIPSRTPSVVDSFKGESKDDGLDEDYRPRIYDKLHELKKADRALFDPVGKSTNYATVCQKPRQPIVVDKEELSRISPESYNGEALAMGSTAQLAERNRYICPHVWCPQSRVAMSKEEFERAGQKCPGQESTGEQALVYDHSYWEDRLPFINHLKPGRHPLGFCMPCCAKKPLKIQEKKKCQSVIHGEDSSHGKNVSLISHGTNENENENEQDRLKYIKGLTTPLDKARFGLLPAAVMEVFNGTEKSYSGVCGSRMDGTGHIGPNTSCFVRKGIPPTRQRFLQCMIDILDIKGVTPDGLADHIADKTTPAVFLGINDGYLCRMFMSDDMIINEQSNRDNIHSKDMTLTTFLEWIKSDHEYHEQIPSSKGVAKKIKSAKNLRDVKSLLSEDADCIREYSIYRAFQRFRSYLRDRDIVKTHGLLLGLFNMPLSWLNPEGLNIVIVEAAFDSSMINHKTEQVHTMLGLSEGDGQSGQRGQSGGGQQEGEIMNMSMGMSSATVQCDSPRRFRLSKRFAFVCAQGPYYEPIYRLRLKRRSYSGLIQENKFRYDRTDRVRGILEALMKYCHMEETLLDQEMVVPREVGSPIPATPGNIIRLISSIMGRYNGQLKAQVIDYTFRLVGVVTSKDVFVPFPALMRWSSPSVDQSSSPEGKMMVGRDAPPQIMYVRDVLWMLDPSARSKTIIDLFEKLETSTLLSGYGIQRMVHAARGEGSKPIALVLKSGVVVPLTRIPMGEEQLPQDRALLEQDRGYLEELNIMVGMENKDEPRVRYMGALKEQEKERAKERREVTARLQENTKAFNEVDFLRSGFNPFPLEFRRAQMKRIISEGLGVHTPHIDALADELLYVDDPLRKKSTLKNKYGKEKHQALRNSPTHPDYVFGDMEMIRGVWLQHLSEIIISPFAMPGIQGMVFHQNAKYDEIDKMAKILLLTDRCEEARGSGRSGKGTSSVSVRSSDSSSVSSEDDLDNQGHVASSSAKGTSMMIDKDVMSILEETAHSSGRSMGMSMSGSESFGTVNLKRMRRRHKFERMPIPVLDCNIWKTFALISSLTNNNQETGPILSPWRGMFSASSFRHVIHNALARDLRRFNSNPDKWPDVLFALTTHPTFSRYLQKRGNGVSEQKNAVTRLSTEDLGAILDRPDYVPGLYDLRVLSRFCRVNCIIIDARQLRREIISHEKIDQEDEKRGLKEPPEKSGGGVNNKSDKQHQLKSRIDNGGKKKKRQLELERIEYMSDKPIVMFIYTFHEFGRMDLSGKKKAEAASKDVRVLPDAPRFDIVLHRNVWTKEDSILLYPEDTGYADELYLSMIATKRVDERKNK